MTSHSETQSSEWETLYSDLLKLLGRYGENDFLCHKGFWIVDDNWGSNQQKIYINEENIFPEDVFCEIQNLLKPYSLDWEVICVLNVNSGDGKNKTFVVNKYETVKLLDPD